MAAADEAVAAAAAAAAVAEVVEQGNCKYFQKSTSLQ